MKLEAGQVVLALGLLLLQLALTALGTIIWSSMRRLERTQREQQEKIENLPKEYVLKEDYVRAQVSVERKLEDILSAVNALANNFQVHVGLGGGGGDQKGASA